MSAASEQATDSSRWTGLGPRTVSAFALAVPVLGAVYGGPPWFTGLIVVVGAVMGWEWARMCRRAPFWLIVGGIYLALPCGALIWLRGDDIPGMMTIFWLLAVVWSADSGAFAAGRIIGGPKLAPRISPKKTWAGFLGGVALAGGVASVFAFIWDGQWTAQALPLALWGVAVAVASQIGDLVESAAKRHFGVKDSSALIPGHGGVLDRVDALILGALALAVLKFTLGRTAMPWM